MSCLIECSNDKCDFWCDNICCYGGTGRINPSPLKDEDCDSFEPTEEGKINVKRAAFTYSREKFKESGKSIS